MSGYTVLAKANGDNIAKVTYDMCTILSAVVPYINRYYEVLASMPM